MSPGLPLSAPPQRGLPPLRQWARLLTYCGRGLIELARARRRFARLDMAHLQRMNAAAAALRDPRSMSDPEHHHLGWIAYALPRVARVAPFRSDCLVQALAGQKWLSESGIASTIVIGAELPEGKPFASHAWLKSGETVVTGGEVDRYTVIF